MIESILTFLDALSHVALAAALLGTASLIHGMINHGKPQQ